MLTLYSMRPDIFERRLNGTWITNKNKKVEIYGGRCKWINSDENNTHSIYIDDDNHVKLNFKNDDQRLGLCSDHEDYTKIIWDDGYCWKKPKSIQFFCLANLITNFLEIDKLDLKFYTQLPQGHTRFFC